jgi:hypothetical protein
MAISPANHSLVIGIPRPDSWFDYVHQRLLVGAIPSNKWREHIRECIRVCASDGWVEIVETDGKIVDGGPASQQFNTWRIEGVKTRGVDVNMVQNLDGLMREEGLTNITKQTFTAPFGSWGGKAGELFAGNFKLLSSSAQPLITSVFNVPKEEVEKNCTLMMEEFESYQAYMTIYVYLGQK